MAGGRLPGRPLGFGKQPLAVEHGTLGVDIEKVLAAAQEKRGDEEEKEAEENDDPAGFENGEDDPALEDGADDPRIARAEKIVSYVTLFLTMLLLGGSIVFWMVMMRYLVRSPYDLVNAGQMRALMISCVAAPVVVTIVQALLHRDRSLERWLICICVGGALATLAVTLQQLLAADAALTLGDIPVLICCAVSGCALPGVICAGVRLLAHKIAESNRRANSLDWEKVSRDVRSISDL